jgi:FimV-like protein
MKDVLHSLLWLCLLALSGWAQTVQEADRLFTYGENASQDLQALGIATTALHSDADNYQWLWRAARGHYYAGDAAKGAERLRHYQAGISYGQRATAREPNAAEGHFWLGANYGGFAEERGGVKALSTVKKVRAEMEAVLRLNASYADGSAYLALGELDRQVPRLFGGNLKRALTRLESGVKVAPNNLEMKYALAQAYQDDGRKDDARRWLNEVISGKARKTSERGVQEKARKLLAKL